MIGDEFKVYREVRDWDGTTYVYYDGYVIMKPNNARVSPDDVDKWVPVVYVPNQKGKTSGQS